MFALNTAAWIAIALLTPFWWGLGLLILAWAGDIAPVAAALLTPLHQVGERARVVARKLSPSAVAQFDHSLEPPPAWRALPTARAMNEP
jgi:hypothetical protein